MNTQAVIKTKKTTKSSLENKVGFYFLGFLVILLAVAVYLSTPGSGSKVPTGFSTLSGLSLEETKQQANFEIPMITGAELPFTVTKEEGKINTTEYGSEKVQKVSFHYLNEKTEQEMYIIFSKLDKDIQEFKELNTESVKMPNGINAKYGIIEFGEGLTWVQDGESYGIYNHIHKNQPELGLDKLMEIAKSIMKK